MGRKERERGMEGRGAEGPTMVWSRSRSERCPGALLQ